MYHIQERSFLKIILCCSLFISVKAFAEGPVARFERVEVYDDGRYLGIRGINNSTPYQHGRVWQGVFDRNTSQYATFDAQDLRVRHANTGAFSSSKVAATVKTTVSRAGVLAGVGALVRQGAKLGTKAVPYVGTALLAYDIYETFKEDIQAQGYQYDPETDKFLKYYPAQNCMLGQYRSDDGRIIGCYGVDSSILMKYDRHVSAEDPEIQELMNSRMESIARPYFNRTINERNGYLKEYSFSKCEFDWNGGRCGYGPKADSRSFGSFQLMLRQKYKEEMSAQNLDQILAAKVDADPDRFIKATNFPGYKEDVEVAPGTKLNIGPVTDKSGNPVQVLVSFGRDSQGKTTADVQVTPRPDLTLGSAEAPNVRPLPDTSPATNPSNNPNPNENPGTRPNPEPAPDTNPEPNLKPGTSPGSPVMPAPSNGKDGKDGGILCKMFPRILACDEQPEAEEPNLDLPQNTIDLNFKTDNSFQDNGQCPEPVSFQAFGQTFNISLDPICQLALMMRPIIIAMAWLMAAFFVTKTIREEV